MVQLVTVNHAFSLARLKELLLASCGHSFENEREGALLAAVGRRMKVRGVTDFEEYAAMVASDHNELLRLTEHLTVKETYFFREPDHLSLMVDRLLPEMLEKRAGGRVRIVSAGCSSGEEPYSIAIMVLERLKEAASRVAVAGLDIDAKAVAGAREGVYEKNSFRGSGSPGYGKYFLQTEPGVFKVGDEVRRMVTFGTVNLLSEEYPPLMAAPDVIFYRNVSIYFPEALQRRIFARLAGLLNEGGYLFVGAAETIYHDIGVLSLEEREGLFYYHKAPVRGRGKPDHHSHREGRRGETPAPAARDDHRPVEYRPAVDPVEAGQARRKLEKAREAVARGRWAAALEELATVPQGLDGAAEALTLKAWLLTRESRFDEAREVAQTLVDGGRMDRDGSLLLALAARHRGDGETAHKRLREALYLDPACWLAHFYLGELLQARGEASRARASFEAALRHLKGGSPDADPILARMVNADQYAVIVRHKLTLLKESK